MMAATLQPTSSARTTPREPRSLEDDATGCDLYDKVPRFPCSWLCCYAPKLRRRTRTIARTPEAPPPTPRGPHVGLPMTAPPALELPPPMELDLSEEEIIALAKNGFTEGVGFDTADAEAKAVLKKKAIGFCRGELKASIDKRKTLGVVQSIAAKARRSKT